MKTCDKCGGSFTWRKKGEKWIPWGVGEPHWMECKRNRKRTSEVRFGGRSVGKDFRESCEQCSQPPWEECDCSFTGAERANKEADQRLAMILEG